VFNFFAMAKKLNTGHISRNACRPFSLDQNNTPARYRSDPTQSTSTK